MLFDAWSLGTRNTSPCPQHTFDNCSLKAQRGLGFSNAWCNWCHQHKSASAAQKELESVGIGTCWQGLHMLTSQGSPLGSAGPFSCKFLQASVAITPIHWLLRLLDPMATVSENCWCSRATTNWWLLVRPASQSRMLSQNHSDVATLRQWVACVVSIPNSVFSPLIWHGTTVLHHLHLEE